MPRIFISYRRADNASFTDRLYDKLCEAFSKEEIFLDIGDIPLGFDFRDQIEREITKSDVVLVMIGSNWLAEIKKREQDEADYMRIEIEKALETDTLLIPVLMNDTKMPESHDLPESIQAMAFKQASVIDRTRFESDVTRLIDGIQHALLQKRNQQDTEQPRGRKITILEAYEAWSHVKSAHANEHPILYSNMFDHIDQFMERAFVVHVSKDNEILINGYDTDNTSYLNNQIRKQWIERTMSEFLKLKITINYYNPDDLDDIPF